MFKQDIFIKPWSQIWSKSNQNTKFDNIIHTKQLVNMWLAVTTCINDIINIIYVDVLHTIYKITAKVTANCVHDLESEWPAHNQGKTLGWKSREKTQKENYTIISK